MLNTLLKAVDVAVDFDVVVAIPFERAESDSKC